MSALAVQAGVVMPDLGAFGGANGTKGIHFACMLMSLFSLRDSVYLVWAMILELMARLRLLVL